MKLSRKNFIDLLQFLFIQTNVNEMTKNVIENNERNMFKRIIFFYFFDRQRSK